MISPISTHGSESASRKAVLVAGGWEGHEPHITTDIFVPGLVRNGFFVKVYDTLDVYTCPDTMGQADLVVQCWSMGKLTEKQEAGILAAVAAGTGFAGWHGGVVASFPESPGYLRMVGGTFVWHPQEWIEQEISVVPGHEITQGVSDFRVTTEQYWVLTDGANTVLATSEIKAPTSMSAATGYTWDRAVEMPVVWTRKWGTGKVFVCTLGHDRNIVLEPHVCVLISRGLLWASR